MTVMYHMDPVAWKAQHAKMFYWMYTNKKYWLDGEVVFGGRNKIQNPPSSG